MVLLVVLIVLAVAVLLHSSRFHRYVLAKAQEKATAALGTQIQVRDFALRLSFASPALDLYGITVYGAPPYAEPPLLEAEHIGVRVTITSLFRRTWYLNDLRIDHPVARVFVDRNGKNNLPQSESGGGQSHTSVFDLGVRHAVLTDGEAYLNDRKAVLSADLHDLEFRAAFDPAQRKYTGTLGYRDGHLDYGAYRPIPHNFRAQFEATPAAFTLSSAVLSSGHSQFTLTAMLENYENPRVSGTYDAVVDTAEFRRILKNPSLPSGVIRLAGAMQYQSEPNQPALATTTLNGELSSPVLRVDAPSFRGEISDLAARYSLAKGNAEVRGVRARLLGGELMGALTIRNLMGASRSKLQASLRGVSLAELKAMMNAPALQRVALRGTVDADADAAWGKTPDDLVARANATLQASVGPSASPGITTTGAQNTIPLNSVIHAGYVAQRKQVSLSQSYVRTPQTSVTLNGTVSDRSSLQVRVHSNDLHELETLADMFRSPAPGEVPAPPLGLQGTASFTGAVRGSTAAPQITGQVRAVNLRIRDTAWRLLQTNIEASPSGVSLRNGTLQPADRGRITFSGAAGLKDWAFTATNPIQVTLNASQLNLASLVKAAGGQAPVAGTLSAEVALHGSQLNPVGQGTIALTQARIADEPIQSLNVKFNGNGNAVDTNLALHLPAGTAQATLTYFPKQQGYDGRVQADIRLDRLETVKARNLELTGTLNLAASGRGTVKDPELQASLQIPKLSLHNQVISGISLQTKVANHVADIALDSQMVNTSVRGRGRVNLTGDYAADAVLDTQVIPLAPLVAAYAPAQAGKISGQTELHATVRGPLKRMADVEAHITVPTFAADYKNTIQLAAAGPIRADYANGVLSIPRAVIRGTGTDLQFQGTVPMKSTAPASLLLLGNVDLQLAQLLDPGISSSGQVRFNINSFGPRANPNVQGQVEIINANFASGTVPIGLQNGNGLLTLTQDRLSITRFNGTVGGGTLTASGGVVYRPSLRFDVGLSGKGIRMLYPEGVREALDTNLTLSGTMQDAVLRGQVRLNELSFTPTFDTTDLMGQFAAEAAPPPGEGFSQNLRLDVAVQSTSGVNLVSRTLSLQAAANLRVQGTAADPVVLGRVTVNGGDMVFMNNRYVIENGTIDFVNPVRTEPVVNATVSTTIQQYNIHMRFEGPVDHLRANYSSDPSLPPSDIINLLAFGKTAEASAANPVPGSLQAQSAVASQVSSQVTGRVEKLAGISQLSVDPILGGQTGQNPGARITIQQRVTSNLFVTFGTDATSTQRAVIQVRYRVTPRVTVSGTRDQNGGFGFDARIRKTW